MVGSFGELFGRPEKYQLDDLYERFLEIKY
jgi:hypothetical protein